MKKLLSYLRLPNFLFLAIAVLDCIVIDAFSWACFNGFGGVTMEYTRIGIVARDIIPPLLPIAILFTRLVKLYKCKSYKEQYLVESAGCLFGFGVGILIFLLVYAFEIPLLADWQRGATWGLITIIRIIGWVKYPIH